MRAELARGNVFHGVNPLSLIDAVRTELPGPVTKSQLIKPWVWRTDHRAYAVAAVKFKRPGGDQD